jgi:hypothetical protein
MVSEMNDNELIEFVRSYREPMPLDEVANDLATLGRCGAAITKASRAKWTRDLRRLVAEGRLQMDRSKMLSIPAPPPPAAKQASAPGLPRVLSQQLTLSLTDSQ